MALRPAVENMTIEHLAVLDERIERMKTLHAASVDAVTRAQTEKVLDVLMETRRLLIDLLK